MSLNEREQFELGIRRVVCEARITEQEWKENRCCLPWLDEILRKRTLEAAEGKPILRWLSFDGRMMQRCELSDEYRVFIECQEDG